MNSRLSHRALTITGIVLIAVTWLLLLVFPRPLARLLPHLAPEPGVPFVANPQPGPDYDTCMRSSVPAFAVALIITFSLVLVVSLGTYLLLLARRCSPSLFALVTLFQIALVSDSMGVLARDWHLYLLSHLHLYALGTPTSATPFPVLSGVLLGCVVLRLALNQPKASA